jgi:formate--tetrahydrofolate ligase
VKAGTPVPIGLSGPNQDALARGFPNLEQHIANVKTHGIPVVVAINAFKDDPASELEWLRQQACRAGAAEAAVSTHHADGGKGSKTLRERSSVRPPRRRPSPIFMILPGRQSVKSRPLP